MPDQADQQQQQEAPTSSTGAIHPSSSTVSARRRKMSSRPGGRRDSKLAQLAPGARVMYLLKDESASRPTLFTEMVELEGAEWRETARWVKFEEAVEQGGNRWSKPHVATLSLHALFQLRSCLMDGELLFDLADRTDMPAIADAIVAAFEQSGKLDAANAEELREALLRKHTHQYEQARKNAGSSASGQNGEGGSGFLSAVRSISDIGKSFSHAKLNKQAEQAAAGSGGASLQLPKVESLPKDITKDGSSSELSKGGNLHFLKKLPPGAEASNVLIGELDGLQHHVCAFVRLKEATQLGDMTEVPVPTRFIFLLIGPPGHGAQFREIGRAIATLLVDEIFHDVAYLAKEREDILDGVDEFLDQVTVLPPGEWDPSIRIEPPSKLPSQEKRKQQSSNDLLLIEHHLKNAPYQETAGKKAADHDEHEEGHGNDPALKRTGRFCGGLILDIKRKLPWYASDFKDAFNVQCIATVCFMYFALLAPIVTFGGLLEEATHQRMAAMENLFGGAICGILYHLFAGQPLTIIGSTGPCLVFETIVYDICAYLEIDYLSFRFWIHVWTASIIILMAVTDLSFLVSFITRFTEESFATLIAVIFIYEAVVKLAKISSQLDVIQYSRTDPDALCGCAAPAKLNWGNVLAARERNHWIDDIPLIGNGTAIDFGAVPLSRCRALTGVPTGDGCYTLYDKLFISILLALATFYISITLKQMRSSCYFPSRVRQLLSDFAVMIAIALMTGVDYLVGVNTPKLNVPSTFRPTWEGRGWMIPPFNGNPFYTALLAFFPAILATILIFMDQQITTVIVNRRENKLKKGCGYHLDLAVLGGLIFVVGLFGLPIFVAATVLSINHVNSLKKEGEALAPGEAAQFVGVIEQRLTGTVTFILLGLSVFMTSLLSFIPMPVLYGVFLYMGISALGGIQLWERILLMLMPMKYQPDRAYIRHVPIKKVHLFTVFQVVCLAVLWAVKSVKATSISFPVMLVIMVGVRAVMEKFFTAHELKYLDDPMPDLHRRKKEDKEKEGGNPDGNGDDPDGDGHEQTTIHAVKTEAHLHIPTVSGKVIKIPLDLVDQQQPQQPPSHSINISKEVDRSGLWQHISNSQKTSPKPPASPADKHIAQPEPDDEDAIMIKVIRPSPHASTHNLEERPLLAKDSQDQASSAV